MCKDTNRMCERVKQARRRRRVRKMQRDILEVTRICITALLITFMGIGLYICLKQISPNTNINVSIAGGVMFLTAVYEDCQRRRSWYKK